MIIGLISDTHGLLRKETIEHLEECDLIIHAGDIGKQEIIDELLTIAKVEFVKGNCDNKIEHNKIPKTKTIYIENKVIYLIHDIGKLKDDLKDKNVNIVIYGHSHKSNLYEKDNIIYINPGSVGPKRFKLPITMAKLYINEEVCENEVYKFKDFYIKFITLNV